MLYENAAQLSTPTRLRVETNAMGLGPDAEIMSRNDSRSASEDGSAIIGGPSRGSQRWSANNDSRYDPFV